MERRDLERYRRVDVEREPDRGKHVRGIMAVLVVFF